jgi:hypothetical protein
MASSALANSLATISLCANGLNALAAEESPRTARLLQHSLRSAVETATQLSDAAAEFDQPVPSLMEGLRRAKAYAERVGDGELSQQIVKLQAKIEKARKS